ncbi:MAG: nuclear transport factor 2 family protein [Flavobacteriaceae bacterium]|nr:nuclear transport factor 2 family protein [Flavobacteriaceae bacterium]
MKTKAEQLIIDFFNEVWHEPHNLDAIDRLMTENYKITSAGKIIEGRDSFKRWVQEFQNKLLHAKTESVDLFSNSNQTKVISRWVCSGLNNGIFDLPADLEPVSFTGIAIWTVSDNRLAECWVERSAYELYQKLIAE